MEKYSILRFLNSKNENVASIVTPIRDQGAGGGGAKRKQKQPLDLRLMPEDKVLAAPLNAKSQRRNCNGASSVKEEAAEESGNDEEYIDPPFLLLHEDPKVLTRNSEGNIEWKSEDLETFQDLDDIIKADLKHEVDAPGSEPDTSFQGSDHASLSPNQPPSAEEFGGKATGELKIKLEPNLNLKEYNTRKSLRTTVNPSPNQRFLRDMSIERPTIVKQEPKRKGKGEDYTCGRGDCGAFFDHQMKLNAHVKLDHSKGPVDKDKLFECLYEGCDFSTSRFDNYVTFHEPHHTGEYKYKCTADPRCNFRSTRRDRLQKHMKAGKKSCPRIFNREK